MLSKTHLSPREKFLSQFVWALKICIDMKGMTAWGEGAFFSVLGFSLSLEIQEPVRAHKRKGKHRSNETK